MRIPTLLAPAALLALSLAPAVAPAATVTLDFQGGATVDPDPVAFGDEIYIKEGFEIRARGVYATNEEEAELLALRPPYGLEAALPTFSSNMATGLDLKVFAYTIARAGGGPFSLDAFRADVTDFRTIFYFYEFEDGRTLSEMIRGEVGFIRFAGTRADGSTVETVADEERARAQRGHPTAGARRSAARSARRARRPARHARARRRAARTPPS